MANGWRFDPARTALSTALVAIDVSRIGSVTITHALAHGRVAAVNGTVVRRDGGKAEFCEVFEFANAKGNSVARITSYRIQI